MKLRSLNPSENLGLRRAQLCGRCFAADSRLPIRPDASGRNPNPRCVLPPSRFSRILKGMEVHFSPEVETRLQQLAFAHGKDAEQLVKDTVARMLEDQARFIAGVKKGIEQADRGEFVEHQDVLNRIDRLFQS